MFNDYFSHIAVNLDTDLPHNQLDPMMYVRANCSSSINLTPVTVEECFRLMRNFKIPKLFRSSLL